MLVQPLPVEIEAHTQQLSCTHEYFKTCDFLDRGGGTLVIEHPVVGAGVVGAGVVGAGVVGAGVQGVQ